MQDVTPIIPNTTMKVWSNFQGSPKIYYIYPAEGYAIHNNEYDDKIYDDEGNVIGVERQRFSTLWTQVPVTYDFNANPDGIFAIPLSEIDENQLMEVDKPEHEVM